MKALSEKCRKGFALLAFLLPLSAAATVDRPSVCGWSGTAYHDGGWFTCKMSVPYDEASGYPDGTMRFDNDLGFVLSPNYPAPVRKILLKTTCDTTTPTRILKVAPFVNGVESSSPMSLDIPVDDESSVQTLDFAVSTGVTAFRIFADSGNAASGGEPYGFGESWGVSDICVLYGEKTADEDAALFGFASILPAPNNLRATDIATNSLSIAADAVADASGYRFEVFRLEGTPKTAIREDFPSAPALSAYGWSLTSANASLSSYASSGYYDTSSEDKCALKIDKRSSSGDVMVEVTTPVCTAAICECSFVCKVGSVGKSDVFRVLGRTNPSAAWTTLAEVVPSGTGRTNVTVGVDVAAGIMQVKFAFAASAANFSVAAWDSLRVVYGGDVPRTAVVGSSEPLAEPRLALADLVCGHYAFRAQALGGDGRRDSPWSDEQIVDLAWAGIAISAPTGVVAVPSGALLAVTWNAVASAERYRVTVASADDPDAAPIVVETTSPRADVGLHAIGDYFVAVTAFSPMGLSQATSDSCPVTVSLGRIGEVEAEATCVSEISAAWAPVALADGYRANVYQVIGEGRRTLAGTAVVTECAVSFGGLDASATYIVEAMPLPSEGAELGAQSEAVDLSAARFRKTGAMPLPHEEWTENFDALAGVVSDTKVKMTELDYWQFAKDSTEPEKLLYASGASGSSGGVYVLSDAAQTTNSYALGSLATGSYGCAFGIALVNAGALAVERDMTLSFEMIQRSYKTNRAAYVLEWKMTNGETGILSDGGWKAAAIPDSAPWAADDDNCPAAEYRQTATVSLLLPARLAPGGVLILRWRHPKVTSGPMMAIDNLRLVFRRKQQALRVTVR